MTVYSDAAGNKYLGDCRWGNHDINYPTTNWLKSREYEVGDELWLTELTQLVMAAGFTNTTYTMPYIHGSPSSSSITPFFTSTPPFVGATSFTLGRGWAQRAVTFQNSIIGSFPNTSQNDASAFLGTHFYFSGCASEYGLHFILHSINTNKTPRTLGIMTFTKLLDVNPNFNYYNATVNNHIIWISFTHGTTYGGILRDISLDVGGGGGTGTLGYYRHYIVNTSKSLLLTDAAAYTISCSDGQTPGSQWATDMWVYDNNVTFGYPVIGRVPNMLLGVGDYTYLKPVKIQGTAFPDNGSPWYLPVGTFSGKVLLMRCYSSM